MKGKRFSKYLEPLGLARVIGFLDWSRKVAEKVLEFVQKAFNARTTLFPIKGKQKLNGRTCALMLILLILSIFVLSFTSSPVWASGQVFIRADGSVVPSTGQVASIDNITYFLTGNMISPLVVEKSDIVIDGKGFTIQGPGDGPKIGSNGVDLSGISNVTIKNTEISGFTNGLFLRNSSTITITGNSLVTNANGVSLSNSSSNIISNNTFTNNPFAMFFIFSSNNTISRNILANNQNGITIGYYDGSAAAGSSNSNVFSENSVANTTGTSVSVWASENSRIFNNTFTRNANDINLFTSAGSVISGNTIENTLNGNGVNLWNSSSNTISGNNMSRITNFQAIALNENSSGNTIIENTITNIAGGITLDFANSNSIYQNNVTYATKYPGIGLSNSAGNIISANLIAGTTNSIGVWFGNSPSNSFTNNAVKINSGGGVFLQTSSDNTISGNNITENTNPGGLWLSSSSNNTVSGNEIAFNYQGVGLDSSNANIIIKNNVTDSISNGIWLSNSSSNSIYLNNFVRNGPNAFSSGSLNAWTSPTPTTYTYNGSEKLNFVGNYWSDYSGKDSNNDGVGDAPYSINGEEDAYPLIAQVSFLNNQPSLAIAVSYPTVQPSVSPSGYSTSDLGQIITIFFNQNKALIIVAVALIVALVFTVVAVRTIRKRSTKKKRLTKVYEP
jgi:parallel beta-helix repeat protein